MKTRAFGKINLGLWVLGKREDGYHEIRTIFHPVEIFDEIEVKESQLVRIRCDGGPEGDKNIVIKVLEELSKYKRSFYGADVYIKKKIPVGGGMGGGSSDAAAVLKALNDIYSINLNTEELVKIAGAVGSDVPYFLFGNTMQGKGRGELLERIDTDFSGRFFIFYPGFEISTKWAYSEIDKILKNDRVLKEENFERAVEFLKKGDFERFMEIIENDFEKIVFEYYPFFKNIKKRLIEEGARKVMLSGSGSGLWAYFDKEVNKEFNFGFGQTFWTRTLDWGVV